MQKIIEKMRGPLTCLVVFTLMVMTPFADPQIALASDYAESVDDQMLIMPVLTEMPLAELPVMEEMSGKDASVMEEVPAMEEMVSVAEVPVMEKEISEEKTNPVSQGPIIEKKKSMPLPKWRINITSEQLELLERCVMAEGGGESYECQVAIACVVINRVLSDKYPDTVEGVIKQDGQFSTWPSMIKRAVPTNEVKQAVREALTTEAIPENVLYFRANRYHRWGSRYCRIDNTYFSTP